MRPTEIKDLPLMAMLVALAVALGFVFAPLPNIELITSTVFISGMLLGVRKGLIVGGVTEGMYSIFSPYGMAPPPLLIAQVLSMMITGIVGGLTGRMSFGSPFRMFMIYGFMGVVLTLNFTLLTALSDIFTLGGPLPAIVTNVIRGIGFYILHIASNAMLFVTFVPAVLTALRKFRESPVNG